MEAGDQYRLDVAELGGRVATWLLVENHHGFTALNPRAAVMDLLWRVEYRSERRADLRPVASATS